MWERLAAAISNAAAASRFRYILSIGNSNFVYVLVIFFRKKAESFIKMTAFLKYSIFNIHS